MHRVHAAPLSRALPVTVLTAAESGPTVLLLAGLGGDEAEGMAALQHTLASVHVQENTKDAPSHSSGVGTTLLNRGRIVAVNCCNLDGYDLGCGSRCAASDGLDLGRQFPGMLSCTFEGSSDIRYDCSIYAGCFAGIIEGSLTQRVAFTLTKEFIAHADFVATIHSGGDSGAFQIAPVAGFLKPPAPVPSTPLSDAADDAAKLSTRQSQQQQACADCKMSAGVWAVERGSGTVQEAAEKFGIPSMFVAAAGALGGGAHGSNHDALGLVRAPIARHRKLHTLFPSRAIVLIIPLLAFESMGVCCCVQSAAVNHILNSLRLVQSPQQNTEDTHGRFLAALEESSAPPKLLGVLSDAYAKKQAIFKEAVAAAKAKGEALPLVPTIPMALRAAVSHYTLPSNCVLARLLDRLSRAKGWLWQFARNYLSVIVNIVMLWLPADAIAIRRGERSTCSCCKRTVEAKITLWRRRFCWYAVA